MTDSKTAINVQQIQSEPSWKFDVEIVDSDSITRHQVTLSKDFYQRLETDALPAKVIELSFRFLLEHEPKEAILSSFDLSLISRYFPDYEEVLKTRIS